MGSLTGREPSPRPSPPQGFTPSDAAHAAPRGNTPPEAPAVMETAWAPLLPMLGPEEQPRLRAGPRCWLLALHHSDERQVPVLLRVVQPVAHDEPVVDHEALVV